MATQLKQVVRKVKDYDIFRSPLEHDLHRMWYLVCYAFTRHKLYAPLVKDKGKSGFTITATQVIVDKDCRRGQFFVMITLPSLDVDWKSQRLNLWKWKKIRWSFSLDGGKTWWVTLSLTPWETTFNEKGEPIVKYGLSHELLGTILPSERGKLQLRITFPV